MRKYNCYVCQGFDDGCHLAVKEINIHKPCFCPWELSGARWEEEGVDIDFQECLEAGCDGMSTTYKTIGDKIFFNCPDCGHKSETNISQEPTP